MWKKEDGYNEDSFGDSMKPAGKSKGGATTASVSTLGPKSFLSGEIKGAENFVIHGNFDGTASLENNVVTIAKSGKVKGTIIAKLIMVEGMIEGDMKASEKIIIKATANIKGNIVSARLVMEDGCQFQGSIDMTEMELPSQIEETAPPPASSPLDLDENEYDDEYEDEDKK